MLALADLGPELGTLRSRATSRGCETRGPLDAVIQIGTDYPIHTGAPVAVLQDRTVQQALATGYPRWLALPDGALRTLVERQAQAYRLREGVLHAHGVAGGVDRATTTASRRRRSTWSGSGQTASRPTDRGTGRSPRFLFIGREWDRKRGDAVVAAFARLRDRVPDARLDVVGGHPPLRERGVTGHGIQAAGPGVAGLLGVATCLVVPSLVEPAGLVYVEAGASGIASIGTTVGGAANVIGDARAHGRPRRRRGAARRRCSSSPTRTPHASSGSAHENARGLFTWRAMAGRVMRALELPLAPDEADVPPPLA